MRFSAQIIMCIYESEGKNGVSAILTSPLVSSRIYPLSPTFWMCIQLQQLHECVCSIAGGVRVKNETKSSCSRVKECVGQGEGECGRLL